MVVRIVGLKCRNSGVSEKWAVGIEGCRNSGLIPYIFLGAILNIGHGWNYVIVCCG